MPPTVTPRPPRSGYRRLRAFAVGLLGLQFVVGMGGYLTPSHEIFPFTSWFLFLLVPHDTVSYDLILRANDGNPIDPPRPYSQLPWLVSSPHSVTTYQLVQQLGDAEARRDAARSRKLRRQIEVAFTQRRVQYDLVRNTYEPVASFETGQVRTSRTVRSFTAGEP